MVKKISYTLLGFLVLGSLAIAQSGMFGNFPIVGGASYSCGSVNGVSNCTVSAGPTSVTGSELVIAQSGISTGGGVPSNVLISMASLGALPMTVVTVTTPPAGISAGNLSGGVLYTSTGTITSANITLPVSPYDQQRYRVASNRTITTLSVVAGAGSSMGGNTQPTVLTASTTGPQGYEFMYNKADTSWYRIR